MNKPTPIPTPPSHDVNATVEKIRGDLKAIFNQVAQNAAAKQGAAPAVPSPAETSAPAKPGKSGTAK